MLWTFFPFSYLFYYQMLMKVEDIPLFTSWHLLNTSFPAVTTMIVTDLELPGEECMEEAIH